MREIVPTPRTRVVRLPKRASYDRATIEAILDEGLICHVGFAIDGQPYVIPTIDGRIGRNWQGAWVRLKLVRKERAWVGSTQRRGGGNPIDIRLLKVSE